MNKSLFTIKSLIMKSSLTFLLVLGMGISIFGQPTYKAEVVESLGFFLPDDLPPDLINPLKRKCLIYLKQNHKIQNGLRKRRALIRKSKSRVASK